MSEMNVNMPRPEHPKPQFVRENWLNLNGEWDFAFDFGKSYKERGWAQKGQYDQKILVPFCPESELSGIGYTDFIPAVWYHRTVNLTAEQLIGRVILHFGAVDYHTEVFVNGKAVGTHDGGYVSFFFDITNAVKAGINEITVYVVDDLRSGKQPCGKQCCEYYSHDCSYTRTTGIWQTVWMEFVPETYIKNVKVFPNVNTVSVTVQANLNQMAVGYTLTVAVYFEGREVGKTSVKVDGANANLTINLTEKHIWMVGEPNLYDLVYTLEGQTTDIVNSYFGLRSVSISDRAICINENPVFQRLVLDQGFYPDGIYTAPSDEALKQDILMSQAVGFNGARLHEKVFEERFLYWADKLGYLVWGEYPNWGLDYTKADCIQYVMPEWIDEVTRDFNHPALVGWCPFNETWDVNGAQQSNYILSQLYHITKALDPTRPCIDTSGNFHVITDIYDVHDYEQIPEKFVQHYEPMKTDFNKSWDNFPQRQHHEGQPYFVSEYGGTWWNAEMAAKQQGGDDSREASWGYGEQCVNEMQVGERIAALTKVLLDNPNICAFCYTQLTDVEQEQNGVYDYHRHPKFSKEVYEVIRKGFTAEAAIESKEPGAIIDK